jgi:hypothetical protein
MRKVLSFVVVIIAAMVSVSAQTRQDRKQYVADNSVTLGVDKAATAGREENSFTGTSYSYPADEFKPGVVVVGPRTTYLKEGLSIEEVKRLLGKPSAVSERSEKDVVVTIYAFPRGEGHVLVAEFVKGLLVRSTMETRGQVAQANR